MIQHILFHLPENIREMPPERLHQFEEDLEQYASAVEYLRVFKSESKEYNQADAIVQTFHEKYLARVND